MDGDLLMAVCPCMAEAGTVEYLSERDSATVVMDSRSPGGKTHL